MEDLKNGYLNEQGLRQERDALRAENARLRKLAEDAGNFCVASDAENARLREALIEANIEAEGWQPMETAPKDGTLIDLWAISERVPIGIRIADCGYFKGKWLDGDGQQLDGFGITASHIPTYWRHPPAPPKK